MNLVKLLVVLSICLSIELLALSTHAQNDVSPELKGLNNAILCKSPQKVRKLSKREMTSLSVYNKMFKQKHGMSDYDGYLVHIKNFGTVYFYTNGTQFLLIQSKAIIYKSSTPYSWSGINIKAVSFYDLNRDGYEDVTIITEQMTGVGPTGAQGFPVCYIFMNNKKKGFSLLKNKEEKGDDISAYLFPFKDFDEVLRFARKRFKG